MASLVFEYKHAEEAIKIVNSKSLNWLYKNYPRPCGKVKKSFTSFLIFEDQEYPVKPLGRLANEIAGSPIYTNLHTSVFSKRFKEVGYKVKKITKSEIEKSNKRQRKLALCCTRPEQAKFRKDVFERYNSRCLITGCKVLDALEAAHIQPVSKNGTDDNWNGIPLRADIHRLFDSGAIKIHPKKWLVSIDKSIMNDYHEYDGIDLSKFFQDQKNSTKISSALRKRNKKEM